LKVIYFYDVDKICGFYKEFKERTMLIVEIAESAEV